MSRLFLLTVVRSAVFGPLLLALNTASAIATEVEIVPYRDPTLANGYIDEGECVPGQDLHYVTDEKIDFFLRQDSNFVYISVRDYNHLHTGLDLYISSDSGCYLLHISSALGQAIQHDGGWTELDFKGKRLWSANVVPVYLEGGERRIAAPEVFEFQISKEILGGKRLQLMTHFKRPEAISPFDADTNDPATWTELELSR